MVLNRHIARRVEWIRSLSPQRAASWPPLAWVTVPITEPSANAVRWVVICVGYGPRHHSHHRRWHAVFHRPFRGQTSFCVRYAGDMFAVGAELSDWQSGDFHIIREYMKPR
jgi:hypothetical protein